MAYSDWDWARDLDDWSSTMWACIFFRSNLSTWMAKKQTTISRSSTEAKHCSLALTTGEVQWCCYLFRELGIPLPVIHLIHCDMFLPNGGQPYFLCSHTSCWNRLPFFPPSWLSEKLLPFSTYKLRTKLKICLLNLCRMIGSLISSPSYHFHMSYFARGA